MIPPQEQPRYGRSSPRRGAPARAAPIVWTADHALVLKESDGLRMLFAFQGFAWGLSTLVLAAAAMLFTVEVLWSGPPGYRLAGVGVSLLFLYSTLFSFHARRSLEILGTRRIVRYTHQTLQRRESWEKAFSEFEAVVLARPVRRNRWGVAVLLKTRDGEHLPLGTNASGWASPSNAKALADAVAGIMGLPVVGAAPLRRP